MAWSWKWYDKEDYIKNGDIILRHPIVATSLTANDDIVDYSCCFATSVPSVDLFKDIALSKVDLLKSLDSKDIDNIFSFFDIKVEFEIDSLETDELFSLDKIEYHLKLKKLTSIIIDVINYISEQLDLSHIASGKNPLGGTMFIFSSSSMASSFKGDDMTHDALDLLEMSGILK